MSLIASDIASDEEYLPEQPVSATRHITLEALAYFVVGLLALTLRLWALGAHPLSDVESVHALSAFRLLHSQQPYSPYSPITTKLALLIFFAPGASELPAGLGSAIAGSMLVFTPYLFR